MKKSHRVRLKKKLKRRMAELALSGAFISRIETEIDIHIAKGLPMRDYTMQALEISRQEIQKEISGQNVAENLAAK